MDYEKAYKDIVRDIDLALEGNCNEQTRICLENIKQCNTNSEDERIRKEIIGWIEDGGRTTYWQENKDSWIAYLEKQKKQKSVQDREEREYVCTLKLLIADFLRDKEEVNRGYYQDIYDWLDKRHIEQNPVEWSEEDETYLQDALWCIEKSEKVAKDEGDMGACWSARKWLKSLREKLKED